MAAKGGKGGSKGAKSATIAQNRRARHDYEVIDTFEAGVALVGPEVKSLRAGKANLTDAYALVIRGDLVLKSLHISPYPHAARENPDPRRDRRLLMHKNEIAKLAGKVAEKGLTLVPLSLYWKDGRAKVELALVRGRRSHDKRQAIRKREEDRELRGVLRRRQRGRS